MSWLTPDGVVQHSDRKIQELREWSDHRRVSLGLVQQEWWSSSIGVEFAPGDRETCYVTRAPIGQLLAEHNVVVWTHWIGRLLVQVRDWVEQNGGYPVALTYGAADREEERPVGPWVHYRFAGGSLADHRFRSAESQVAEAAQEGGARAKPAKAPEFGLRDIIDLRDLGQDDLIRGPMKGVHVLTGGPGVGKTTVALHRIAYLLNEQRDRLPVEAPGAPSDFFQAPSMQVIVWKEHLVTYLEKCLAELGYTTVPVRHVDDWVAKALRSYVPFGRGANDYRLDEGECPSDAVKLGQAAGGAGGWRGISEDLVRRFLVERSDDGGFRASDARKLGEAVESLSRDLEGALSACEGRVLLSVAPTSFTPTMRGVEVLETNLLRQLGELRRRAEAEADLLSRSFDGDKKARAALARADAKVVAEAEALVKKGMRRLQAQLKWSIPSILAEFFQSEIVHEEVKAHLGAAVADRFRAEEKQRSGEHLLSRADRYFVLWIAHILTRGKTSEVGLPALERYSHIVVDEAQYYEPIVLRLLIDLTMDPLNSMTIVGDLEQKVTASGGLLAWADAGIAVQPDRVFRLSTSYRWSREVFGFLEKFRRSAGVREHLEPPRRWSGGDGSRPVVVRHASDEAEDRWLVDSIVRERGRAAWSIAVVVPPGSSVSRWRDLVRELGTFDVRARWATGEDVRECEEKVVLTDHESIVGLEFDAVFLPGCQSMLPPEPSVAGGWAVGAAWVAFTRAKQFLAASHVGPVRWLEEPVFDEYRPR